MMSEAYSLGYGSCINTEFARQSPEQNANIESEYKHENSS